MTRLPYGTFKNLTPEEQKAHMRMLYRKNRKKNKEKRNSYNKKFFEKWKEELPFVCVCKHCGAKFNACRNNRCMCPHCHQEKHIIADLKRKIKKWEQSFKQNRDLMIINMAKRGVPQKEIATTIQVSQRVVSAVCIKKGLRRKKYVSRIK